jgi:glycosyltransferase involved in cell wall biosynthesis
MRICFVAFQFWPSVGGSQTQVEKQARCLQQLGHEVLVVTLRHQKTWLAREKCADVPVIRVGGLYRSDGTLRVGRLGHLFVDLLLFFTLWRLRHHYDLIHTLQISPLAVVAALVGKLTHKPVIVGVQSTGPDGQQPEFSPKQMTENPDTCGKTKSCANETALQPETGGDLAGLREKVWGGQWMLNYLRKSHVYYQVLSSRSYVYLVRHGFRPERIIYIPNGVDTRQFYPDLWRRETAPYGVRRLLCVARLEYAKGIDVLLHAWARMMNMPAAWRFGLLPKLSLVGDGTRRMELEQIVADLGIEESVEFLGTRHDIARLMQKAWGFVLPSRWEGMPNALLEAMACCLPCIATRVSGSEDVIEQGVNGLLVEPEQPEQLAYALRLLIDDANLARQLSWQGYKTVLSSYQLDATVQESLTFYHYLLDRKGTLSYV